MLIKAKNEKETEREVTKYRLLLITTTLVFILFSIVALAPVVYFYWIGFSTNPMLASIFLIVQIIFCLVVIATTEDDIQETRKRSKRIAFLWREKSNGIITTEITDMNGDLRIFEEIDRENDTSIEGTFRTKSHKKQQIN